jgi:MFS family permease
MPTSPPVPAPGEPAATDQRNVRKAATASFLGSMLEYYDFYIYGSAAALVFNKVFFSQASPGAGTLAALATFGVGYVARPIGGIVLGHLGDRIGRKKVMLFTVVLMGLSTFLIGCIPGYESIGVAAPVLLVVLRLLGGFSAGGEQAGANALTLEHSPPRRRAFFTSWTLSGTQAGFILASAVFLAVAQLPEEALLSWGWRIPFWSSIVVIALAWFVRRSLDEPEAFRRTREDPTAQVRGSGLAVLRTQPLDVLRVLLCAFTAIGGSIFSVFALSFATGPNIGLSRSTMLWVAIAANVCALGIIPVVASLSDRIGRKPVFVAGSLGTAAFTFLYLWSLTTGDIGVILLGAFLMTSVCYTGFIAVWPAFFAEMFPTRTRYSGTAIGTQFGFGLAGFAPTIGYALVGPDATDWLPVAIFTAVALVIAAGAALTARETYLTPLDELGVPDRSAAGPGTDRTTVTTA